MRNLLSKIVSLSLFAFSPMLHAMTADQLGHEVKTSFEKYSIVGLSAVVVKHGAVIWNTNFGLADIDRKLPVTDQTKFRIASISKLSTATALMQLWEKGKFKLDDDISKYLGYPVINPNFPKVPITFRHLLTHTTSFVDVGNYDRFLQETYQAPDRAIDFKELISAGGSFYENGASFSKEHAPGTHYSYSNQGYGLLGTLVEKISGERFDLYCEKNIYKPLGMTATFNPNHLPDINDLAVLYRKEDGQWKPQADDTHGERPAERGTNGYKPGHNALIFSPQGGLRVSALDLAKLMMNFMDSQPKGARRVLKKSTIKLMLTEAWPLKNKTTDSTIRGLGFHITPYLEPKEKWVGHGGDAYGLLSDLYLHRAKDIGVILITNGSLPGKDEREFHQMEREILESMVKFAESVK